MNVNDIKKGVYLDFKNGVWQVIEFQHVFPGKGNAFVRTKLKNAQTGKVVDHTFKANETVDDVPMETSNAQYMYNDGTEYYFMDNTTYEQFELKFEDIEEMAKYLTDGQEVLILKKDGVPMNITLPKKIQMKVVEAPPGVKGDSASSATKQVTMETGLMINVPLFIKVDDILVINTESGEYVERVS